MSAVMSGIISRVVISDGGSSDQTSAIADGAGAIFVSGRHGRGPQLALGAEALSTSQKGDDWLLFLHADTTLQEGWEQEVAQFIASAPYDQAAYFKFQLAENAWQARLVELGVRIRCRIFRMPYGDQALLISRKFYDELGGFAAIPLFEDVDLVARIKRVGKILPLQSIAQTSAARYKQDGYFARVRKNFSCILSYYQGVPPEKILEKYQ